MPTLCRNDARMAPGQASTSLVNGSVSMSTRQQHFTTYVKPIWHCPARFFQIGVPPITH